MDRAKERNRDGLTLKMKEVRLRTFLRLFLSKYISASSFFKPYNLSMSFLSTLKYNQYEMNWKETRLRWFTLCYSQVCHIVLQRNITCVTLCYSLVPGMSHCVTT